MTLDIELPSLKAVLNHAKIDLRLQIPPKFIKKEAIHHPIKTHEKLRKVLLSHSAISPENFNAEQFDIESIESEKSAQENSTQCSICSKIFKNVSVMKKHLTSVHGPKLPCEYCGKMLKVHGRKDVMRQHVSRCQKYRRLQNLKEYNQTI
eukprot:NODE_489_length_6860_cov_1.209289.p5 type:complete len:150 gc:universal NODE_489_length_6860_cov_1.209289:4438-4887(+)